MTYQLPFGPTVRTEPGAHPPAYDFGTRRDGERHGVVLTKRHVVELILDMCGYLEDRDLVSLRFLEPACGHGAFVTPAVERLARAATRRGEPWQALGGCVRAYDIDADHVAATRAACAAALQAAGASSEEAGALARTWIQQADFLLAPMEAADVVVGNPPYVRIEQIAPALLRRYRSAYSTLFDRADLYVAFYERSLHLLSPRGVLGFLCADRWMRNRYGGPLRDLIARSYSVRAHVDLHSCSPFESEVIAYPSILVVGRDRETGPVCLATMSDASPAACGALAAAWRGGVGAWPGTTQPRWFDPGEPWLLAEPREQAQLRWLEQRFLPLEHDPRTRVGIGVATGADDAYLVGADADIEPDRLLPLVRREDIQAGRITDAGRRVILTFDDRGRPIDLRRYPRLAAHLDAFPRVRERHVARKNAASWFRTIDRVHPALTTTPKLLIPDIAGSLEVTLDEGRYYPHHNLYYVTSQTWDLHVLGGLLSSRVALFFVWAYATRMRGGYLRFQAQFLRKIRVPAPDAVPAPLARKIASAFRARDFASLDRLAAAAYGLEAPLEFSMDDRRR